jgi:hypothetical protein
MMPFPNYQWLNFLIWVAEKRPQIVRLPSDANGFSILGRDFEMETGHKYSYTEDQWYHTFLFYKESNVSEILRNQGSPYHAHSHYDEYEDSLERYKKIPLHAIFLYSTLDKSLTSYIKTNWYAFHRRSADYCDIHPTLAQLNEYVSEDATDLIRDFDPIVRSGKNIDYAELPGIFFWDHKGAVEFISLKYNTTVDGINNTVTKLLTELEVRGSISSITKIKESLLNDPIQTDHSFLSPKISLVVQGNMFMGDTVEGDKLDISGDVKAKNIGKTQMDSSKSEPTPWASGSFYLVALLAIGVLFLVAGNVLSIIALPIVILGSILGFVIMGALQLRQSKALSEKNFLALIALSFKQLPIIRGKDKNNPIDKKVTENRDR